MPVEIKLTGTIVVTGGNRGLGKALAGGCAQAGANVAIIYHSSKDAPQIAEEMAKKHGVKVKAYQADVGNQELVRATFETIEQELGEVTGVVANAGVAVPKPALEYTHEEFSKTFDVNVFGVFNACQAAARHWVERKRPGSIVIVASMSSQIVNAPLKQCFYNSSKAAVAQLGRCLAWEWAEHKIRVNVHSPGFIATDQTKGTPKEIMDKQCENTPLGRFSQPEEHVGQCLLLLSDLSSYQTGAEFFVDGGYLAL